MYLVATSFSAKVLGAAFFFLTVFRRAEVFPADAPAPPAAFPTLFSEEEEEEEEEETADTTPAMMTS